jgi:hypothetical protein
VWSDAVGSQSRAVREKPSNYFFFEGEGEGEGDATAALPPADEPDTEPELEVSGAELVEPVSDVALPDRVVSDADPPRSFALFRGVQATAEAIIATTKAER